MGMVVLQLCRWKVSHKETLVYWRLYSTEVDFYLKKRKKIAF